MTLVFEGVPYSISGRRYVYPAVPLPFPLVEAGCSERAVSNRREAISLKVCFGEIGRVASTDVLQMRTLSAPANVALAKGGFVPLTDVLAEKMLQDAHALSANFVRKL